MSLETIDEILDALADLGYPTKLSELARILERHMAREKFVEILNSARFSQRSRDIIDLVLGLTRDELRNEVRWRLRRGNSNVVHHFDVAKVAPTIRQLPPVNHPQYALTETQSDWRQDSPVRVLLDATSERKEQCNYAPEEGNQTDATNN